MINTTQKKEKKKMWPDYKDPASGKLLEDAYKEAPNEGRKSDLSMKASAFLEGYRDLCETYNMFLWPDDPYCSLDIRTGDGKKLDEGMFKQLDDTMERAVGVEE